MRSWLDNPHLESSTASAWFARAVDHGNWEGSSRRECRDPYHCQFVSSVQRKKSSELRRVSVFGGSHGASRGGTNVFPLANRTERWRRRPTASEKIRRRKTRFDSAIQRCWWELKDRGIATPPRIQSIFKRLCAADLKAAWRTHRPNSSKGAGRFELILHIRDYTPTRTCNRSTRLKQAPAGPAGYISMEDCYAIELVQQAIFTTMAAFVLRGSRRRRGDSRVDLVPKAPIRDSGRNYQAPD